jgi:diguanylate cyclase (GGDEF)-like protein/PAS domain S-box-containing protein
MEAHPDRLLVVDDDSNNRDMLSRRLARKGYAVDVAEDGPTALEKISQAHYDLVLLDQMMPGMSGLDLLRLLRATYSANDLPVIMVTAVDQTDTVVEALNGGANDYVMKPVDLPVMAARIEAQLSRAKQDREIRESEQRYSLAARGSNDGLWDWDLLAGTIYYSPRWLAILGYEEGDFQRVPEEWLTRLHPDDEASVREELRAHIEDHSGAIVEFSSEHRIRNKAGEYQWVLSRGAVMHGDDGRPLRFAGSLTDISTRKNCDPLTGLGNRSFMLERVAGALTAGANFALILLDLDGFKILNDSFGHHTGDRILCATAARMQAQVSALGLAGVSALARIGGDEFTILLEKLENPAQAMNLAERLIEHIGEPASIHGFQLAVTASAGIALGSADAASAEDVMRDADLAMYRAKEMGKNRCALFAPQLRDKMQARMKIAHDLHRALENGQLVAYYQPKVDLKTLAITGFEALLRWRHPKLGLIQPNDFIPIAEETGLIVPIGEWILEEACCQLKTWQNMFPRTPQLSMNVNLSVKQLTDPNLLDRVRQVLDRTGVDPKTLKLELTETALMTEIAEAKQVLDSLRAMHIGLKLDDFGTGYSSLNYLRDLHFDSLKIDRSFVARIALDAEGSKIVETMIKLAQAMDMNVVAEGIEDEQQLKELVRLGCDTGQGFYFSKPVESGSAEKMLERSFAGPEPAAYSA